MTGSQAPAAGMKDRLYEIIRGDESFEQKAREALDIGVEYLGVQNGHLTRIDQETDYWEAMVSTDPPDGEFPPGLELDLQTTYCRRTIRSDGQIALNDVPNEGWADDRAFEEHELHCYHGTRLILDNAPYGTVCFVSEEPRDAFTQDEMMFIELIARLLERELERQRHEAELTKQANLAAVLNRVLRHNLRNDLSVIRGHTQLMADKLEGGKSADTALRNIDELIELSEKARKLDQVVAATEQRTPSDVVALVKDICDDVRKENSAATVTVEAEEDVTVPLRSNIDNAVTELVENAVKHSGQQPRVSVEIETVPNAVEISVTDNGPGLSEQEATVLESGTETSLTHGSGLGLWLVHWIVSSHGGSTTATASEDGTIMTISLPRKPATNVQQQLAKLSRARDRYHAAFQEATDAMVIINDDARIVEANPQASEIYGMESRELLGRELTTFLPEGYDFGAAWESFQQEGDDRDTVTIVGADGVDRLIEYAATTNIVPGQHLVISRDISDRIEREEALEETTRRLEAIINASPDPEIAVDGDGIVQLWNDAAEDVFEYSQTEAVGKSIRSLGLHEGDEQAEFEERFAQAMGGNPVQDTVVERVTKGGDTRHVRISVAPIRGESATMTGVVAVCRDVTEQVDQ